jgi:hypothetical protein
VVLGQALEILLAPKTAQLSVHALFYRKQIDNLRDLIPAFVTLVTAVAGPIGVNIRS